MNRHLTFAGLLAGLSLLPASAEPVVTVSPYDHKHVYETGATGFTWYHGHLYAAENTNEILRWLFQDLNIDYVRTRFLECETANDNSNPLSINWSAYDFPEADTSNEKVYHDAKLLNPRLKVMTYGHNIPSWLVHENGTLDYSKPNLYPEIAEWLFANMVDLKQSNGIDCGILDIYNEPDWTGFGQNGTGNLLKNVVPLLRAWVNDPVRNPYGVIMPKIMAPSCLNASIAKDWLTDWYANDPAIWNNIDIVSTHQYGGGNVDGNYSAVNRIRGGRPFMQSEMHTSDGSELNSALKLGEMFCSSVNNGVSVYDYYMGVSPQDGSTSLIDTPRGEVGRRRKVYFTFKQLSSMQTRGSNVVKTSIANGDAGYDAIAYHHWSESKTWLTVSNKGGTNQPIRLKLLDQTGSPLPIHALRVYETSASRNAELVSDETFVIDRPDYLVQLPGNCMRTFEITWSGTNGLLAHDEWEDLNSPHGGGSGWNGDWVRSGSPLPLPQDYNHNVAARFRGNGSGEAAMSRELAAPLTGDGILRFKWDVDSLDEGERVEAQVFDGAWHQVWYATSLSNGSDADGNFDDVHQQNASIKGFGPITKIRFVLKGDSSGDYLHLDDVEVVSTFVPSNPQLLWKGDGIANRWATDATTNWLSGTTPASFTSGALAVFDGSGQNTPAISIDGLVEPLAVSVNASKDYTIGGTGSIVGSGSLEKRGSAKLTLTTDHTYSGGTLLEQGYLEVAASGALGSGPVTVAGVDGNTVRLLLGSGVILANPVTIGEASPGVGQGVLGLVSGSVTFSGPVNFTRNPGNGGHIKGPLSGGTLSFTGPLTQSGTASKIYIRDGRVRLSGGGSYGRLGISAGTTSLGAHNGISTSAIVELGESGNATLDLNGWNQTLVDLDRVAGTVSVTNSATTLSTLTLVPGNTSRSYPGDLAGNLRLALAAGTFEFTGPCSFTGGVLLSGGKLLVQGQFSGSGVDATGGTLGGTGTLAGPSMIRSGATLSPGNAVGTIHFGSSLAIEGGTWKSEIDSGAGTTDLVTTAGAVTIAPGSTLSVSDLAATPVVLAGGTKLALLDYTGGSLTGVFGGLPNGAILAVGSNIFAIDYDDTSNGTGQFVTLTAVSPATSYVGWAATSGIGGRPFDVDTDGDGLANGLEWILGGNPGVVDAAGRVAIAGSTASGLTLAFRRDGVAGNGTALFVDWTTDLAAGWTHSVPIGPVSANAEDGVIVTVSGDEVTVLVPGTNAVDGKLFARIRGTGP